VNDKMLGFTYERRFEAHPDYPQLWAIRKAIRELRSAKRRGTDSYHQKLDRLRSRETELELRINNELFNSARVISCTLAGSASRVLEGMKFATLFIDEAAQALEAACWIALRKANRVVCVRSGDMLDIDIEEALSMTKTLYTLDAETLQAMTSRR
jgi:hypothetical protein